MENLWRVMILVPFFIAFLVSTVWFAYECMINNEKPWSYLILCLSLLILCSSGIYIVFTHEYPDEIKKCVCECCVHN